jgi:hypothetical protein
MDNKKDLTLLDVVILIDQFEDDIFFKRGHIDTRIERSKARKEIILRGKIALGDIVIHLNRLHFRQDGEAAYAWRNLLEEMRTVHGLTGNVEHYMLLDSWIKWAESHTPKNLA